MKKTILSLHRLIGLTIGFIFVLLGLSGSYLVYSDYFERNLFAERNILEKNWENLDLAHVIKSVQENLGRNDYPTALEVKGNNRSVIVGFTQEKNGLTHHYYDPVKNIILDSVPYKNSLKGNLFFFHHDFFMKAKGRIFMFLSGILMLFLLISGLYLWWPKKNLFLKALYKLRVKNLFLIMHDSHRLIGFYTLLLMMIVTFSGVYISTPSFGRSPSPLPHTKKEMPLLKSEVVYQKLIDTYNGQEKLNLFFHPRAKKYFLSKGEVNERFIFDPLKENFTPMDSRQSNFSSLMKIIHEGKYTSELWKFLLFLSGLIPLILYSSGIYLWIKKSKGRLW